MPIEIIGLIAYNQPSTEEFFGRWANRSMAHDTEGVAFTERDESVRQQAAEYNHEYRQYQNGLRTDTAFRTRRIAYGVHHQRPPSEQYMIRVKIPYGLATTRQWRTLARVAKNYHSSLHLTTRQAIELHNVSLEATPAVVSALAAEGLSTCDAGGNGIRNVTACPLIGICPRQAFNPVAIMRQFVRGHLNTGIQAPLPKKVKMGVSGCGEDCLGVRSQDIGVVARNRCDQAGFRIYVGGGIGSAPQSGTLFEDFVPAAELGTWMDAIVLSYRIIGERDDRHHARLKWLVADLGMQAFHEFVVRYRNKLVVSENPTDHGTFRRNDEGGSPSASNLSRYSSLLGEWVKQRVWTLSEDQVAVRVPVAGGMMPPDEMSGLAAITENYGSAQLSITTMQEFVIRNIPSVNLPPVYAALHAWGPERMTSVPSLISCAGSPACNLALTRSQDLTQVLRRMMAADADCEQAAQDPRLSVRISGCPHSCSHARVAPLGLIGGSLHVKNLRGSVPVYTIWIGGSEQRECVRVGVPVARIPARRVPEALRRLFHAYVAERKPGEGFEAWSRNRWHLNTEEGEA